MKCEAVSQWHKDIEHLSPKKFERKEKDEARKTLLIPSKG